MSKKKKSKKLKKVAKSKLNKLDKKLQSTSSAVLTISVDTGKKWKKLFKQKVKLSKSIRGKQTDMFFDTFDAVRGQILTGAKNFKKELGIKQDIVAKIQKKMNKSDVVNQLSEYASKRVLVLGEAALSGSTKNGAVKIKMEIAPKLGEKKGKSKKKGGKKKEAKKKSESNTVQKIFSAGGKTGTKSGSKRKATALAKATAKTTKKGSKSAKKTVAKIESTEKTSADKGAKRGPKPGSKRTTAKKGSATTEKKITVSGKRGRKPNPGRPGFDDLKKVKGIGAKMENILNEKGIKTYKDLKSVSVRDLQGIINSAGGYYQSFKPQDWKSEAALAADGKFDQMKTGRR